MTPSLPTRNSEGFSNTLGAGLDPRPEPGVAGEVRRHWVELANHTDARTGRRDDDGLVRGEYLDEAPYQWYGLPLVAGVEVHLAAGGLLPRELDLVPEALSNSTVARPVSGKRVSLKQVMNSATRTPLRPRPRARDHYPELTVHQN